MPIFGSSKAILDSMDEVVTSFKSIGVCDQLAEACGRLGWEKPTEIQTEVLPHAFQEEGKDLLGLAQTGSGKTGAFCIPIVQSLLKSQQPFFACVLSPTRMRADQIAKQCEALGCCIGIKCAVLVEDLDMEQKGAAFANNPHIIVATPRCLLKLVDTEYYSFRQLKILVLDEADKFVNDWFPKALNYILANLPTGRRTYLFSATMSSKVKMIERACLQKNHVKIQKLHNYTTVDTLKGSYVFIPAAHKPMHDCYLVHILSMYCSRGRVVMVFTRSCEAAVILALMLRKFGFRAMNINGHMSQSTRLEAVNQFKSLECNYLQEKILVCSDATSREVVDIGDVNLVVNYDVPANAQDYVHRVGSSHRTGKYVKTISLVNQHELDTFVEIENFMGKSLAEKVVHRGLVLELWDEVCEAKRIALSKIKKKRLEMKKSSKILNEGEGGSSSIDRGEVAAKSREV